MAFDLRPRVIFHTSLGAVVVMIDPASPLGGVVQIPNVGNVPYDVNPYDVTVGGPTMIVHLPVYGDTVIPLIPSGSGVPLTIPGLGDVTVEVVLGPPDIPLEQQANVGGLFTAGAMALPLLLIGAVWLVMPKRNPPKRNGRRRKGSKAWMRKVTRYWTEAQVRRMEELNRMFEAAERRKRFHIIRGGKKNPICCP